MAFFIFSLLSAQDLDISPEGFSPRDAISPGLMTRAIWKRPCINLFITYFARADNMLLPQRQITCHSIISIKYVIISKYLLYYIIYLSFFNYLHVCMPHQRILKYNTSHSLFKQLKIHICMEVIHLYENTNTKIK